MIVKATLAKPRGTGQLGAARTQRLYDAGLIVLDAGDYERLTARHAELERENKLLREIAAHSTQTNVIAAQILGKAMTR